MPKRSNPLMSILTGILFTLFFISLGLIITINWKGLYYHDMKALDLSQSSGYSEPVIRENYDALIEYCSPFYKEGLKFPSLPSSPEATQHFAEVKVIFVAFYYILGISLVLLIPLMIYFKRKKNYGFLKISSIITIVLPLIVGLSCAANFDQAFIIFHKLFFRNDYWLFDPTTDPIIDLLPSEFFLHCAVSIIVIVLLGSVIQYVAYHVIKRRSNHK